MAALAGTRYAVALNSGASSGRRSPALQLNCGPTVARHAERARFTDKKEDQQSRDNQVLFAGWPHARLGAPFIDLLMLLSSAAASAIDAEPILRKQPLAAGTEPHTIDAVLAAHAGFCLAGALSPPPPGLQPVADAKIRIGRAAIEGLARRLSSRH